MYDHSWWCHGSFSEVKLSGSRLLIIWSWWRHQKETFSALLTLCVGNSPVTGEFPAPPYKGQWRGALMLSLICALNERFSKQVWGWWFETPSRPLWRRRKAIIWTNADTIQWRIYAALGGAELRHISPTQSRLRLTNGIFFWWWWWWCVCVCVCVCVGGGGGGGGILLKFYRSFSQTDKLITSHWFK